ncbi:MAG: serine hydrolase domain-containing protein, partial [Longimicrobiales bacterium]
AEGRVDLDEPVQSYLSEFPHSATLVRHLLEHSAGLPEFEETDGRTNAELVAALPPESSFEPGSRFRYCNECFDTLALLIERTTGTSWIEFLEHHVLRRLRMDSVFLRPARLSDWSGPRTMSYRTVGDSLVPFDIWDNEAFYGSSNLYLSARDLGRWASAWIAGRVLPEPVRGSAKGVPQFANGERSALNRGNWYYDEVTGPYYFNGHLRGFHHTVYWDSKSGLSVVWVTNVLEPRPNPQLLTRALVRIAEGEFNSSENLEWFGPPDSIAEWTSIHGTFDVAGLGLVTVSPSDIGASIRIDDGSEFDGYPSQTLYLPAFDAEVGFSELRDGRFQKFHWISVFDSLSGRRVAR